MKSWSQKGITFIILFSSHFFITKLCGSDENQYTFFTKKNISESDIQSIPELFTIDTFESKSDGSFSHETLLALTHFDTHKTITRKEFLQALERVRQTERCESLHFIFSGPTDKQKISCSIKTNWIIRSIKIEGIVTEKDDYLQCYTLSTGQPFEDEKHAESLIALKKKLEEQGYKKASLQDHLYYDDQHKWIDILITITKGSLSKIASTKYRCSSEKKITPAEEHAVKKRLQKILAKPCTKALIERETQALVTLLQKHHYQNPSVTIQQTDLADGTIDLLCLISVQDIKTYDYEGNNFFSKSALDKIIKRLQETDITFPPLLLAQELEQEYMHSGFYYATVTCKDIGCKTLFMIDEGPRCALKKITLQGAESYDTDFLIKKFFKKREKTFYFNQKKIHESLYELIEWYKKQGFWDASIFRHRHLSYQNKKNLFCLQIVLEEGKQYCISDIITHGIDDTLLEELPLYKKIKIQKTPIPFPADLLALQKTFLLKKLKNLGYLQPQLLHSLATNEKGLVVVWNCIKGHKTTFGTTILKGQTKIKYSYLMKLLNYKEGDAWNKEKIQQSLLTLRATGVFDKINLFPSYKTSVDNQKDIIFFVKDDDPFEIKLRMGFAQVSKNFYFKKGSTYKIGGSFIWKNPTARADRFSADFDFNRYEQKINVAYRLPLLGNIPLATTFKGYANKYIQPIVIGSSKPLYRILQQGFLMGLSKSGQHYDCGVTSGFEWMEINDVALNVAQALNFETDLVDKKIPYFFIEPMIYADFLDDKINPTKGFYTSASLKGMFPFKESSYFIKCTLEQAHFISLASSVLALRVRTGHIFRHDFRSIMPSERFFLGGPFSLRGYLQDYCPPLGTYQNDKNEITHVPQGGKTMLNGNAELRFPTYKKTLWATIFQDFGILLETPHDIFTNIQPLAATGFGFRYISPIGPLRFDIGWKWHKNYPTESSYAWFLTLGNSF